MNDQSGIPQAEAETSESILELIRHELAEIKRTIRGELESVKKHLEVVKKDLEIVKKDLEIVEKDLASVCCIETCPAP